MACEDVVVVKYLCGLINSLVLNIVNKLYSEFFTDYCKLNVNLIAIINLYIHMYQLTMII